MKIKQKVMPLMGLLFLFALSSCDFFDDMDANYYGLSGYVTVKHRGPSSGASHFRDTVLFVFDNTNIAVHHTYVRQDSLREGTRFLVEFRTDPLKCLIYKLGNLTCYRPYFNSADDRFIIVSKSFTQRDYIPFNDSIKQLCQGNLFKSVQPPYLTYKKGQNDVLTFEFQYFSGGNNRFYLMENGQDTLGSLTEQFQLYFVNDLYEQGLPQDKDSIKFARVSFTLPMEYKERSKTFDISIKTFVEQESNTYKRDEFSVYYNPANANKYE